jgi:hypothetical protein
MLPNREKNFFYNPIKQNQTHINALKRDLPSVSEKNITSIIVFSKRCQLKNFRRFRECLCYKERSISGLINKVTIQSTGISQLCI